MVRPASAHPTPAELEVLKILWRDGPSTVRQIMDQLSGDRDRAYTSVMSLLGVMTDKRLVTRRPHGRAFLYRARVKEEKTLGRLVDDLLGRAFGGSASALVAHLLEESDPTEAELVEIRRTIEAHRRESEGR